MFLFNNMPIKNRLSHQNVAFGATLIDKVCSTTRLPRKNRNTPKFLRLRLNKAIDKESSNGYTLRMYMKHCDMKYNRLSHQNLALEATLTNSLQPRGYHGKLRNNPKVLNITPEITDTYS
jgi:hypothetical protein